MEHQLAMRHMHRVGSTYDPDASEGGTAGGLESANFTDRPIISGVYPCRAFRQRLVPTAGTALLLPQIRLNGCRRNRPPCGCGLSALSRATGSPRATTPCSSSM